MKNNILFSILLIQLSFTLIVCSCDKTDRTNEDSTFDLFKEEISVRSPEPTKEIREIRLTDEQKNMVSGLNHFAFTTLELLNTEVAKKESIIENKSFICSPFSVAIDLAMTANGVKGQARKEILTTLGFDDDDISKYNSFCKTIIEGLPALDFTSTVKLANAVITDLSYPVKKDFKSITESSFYSLTESLPFEKWELVQNRINKWINDSTEGLIQGIIGEQNPNVVAFLLNTLYFKAKFSESFNSEQTCKKTFHAVSKDTSLDFMNGEFELPFSSKESVSALSIPFGKGNYDFTILLPEKECDMTEVLKTLNTDFDDLHDKMTYCNVKVSIPKFNTASSYEFIPTLMNMGIYKIFDPSDFSEMVNTSNPLAISSVLHDAVFSIDENGVEAAGITAIMASGISPVERSDLREINFTADHPFVYLIREKSTDIILFAGIFYGK